ncbi:hypothetical protein P8884_22505 [Bacillus haynesii]|nr:hypothetical protein [Bacillus haynesii]
MTKTNEKIHVLADESLGGIKREYVEVDRKAEVGDKVICLDDTGGDLTIGGMYTIDKIIEEDGTGYGFIDDVGEERAFWDEAKYRVLVPVKSSEEEPQPADPIDVIANLATRVAELERQIKKLNAALPEDMKLRSESTQRYLALQDEIDTLHKDNRMLGEELEALKYAAKETDGKVAHLEADSDMRLFTAEEVAALLNAMRER